MTTRERTVYPLPSPAHIAACPRSQLVLSRRPLPAPNGCKARPTRASCSRHRAGQHAEDFANLTPEEQKRFLLETLEHNALYVNLSEIDDADYGVSEQDKRRNTRLRNDQPAQKIEPLD